MRSGYVVEGDLGSMLGELCGLHSEVIASQGFPGGFGNSCLGSSFCGKGSCMQETRQIGGAGVAQQLF